MERVQCAQLSVGRFDCNPLVESGLVAKISSGADSISNPGRSLPSPTTNSTSPCKLSKPGTLLKLCECPDWPVVFRYRPSLGNS